MDAQTNMEESITNSKNARKDYLDSLAGATAAGATAAGTTSTTSE